MIRVERTDGLGPSRCRACGASIIWALTDRGKRAPIDAEPNPERGNMVLWYDDGGDAAGEPRVSSVASVELITGGTVPMRERRLNHFATCPEADRFQPEKTTTTTAPQLQLFTGGKR